MVDIGSGLDIKKIENVKRKQINNSEKKDIFKRPKKTDS
jgi:hypothetical protein